VRQSTRFSINRRKRRQVNGVQAIAIEERNLQGTIFTIGRSQPTNPRFLLAT